MEILNCELWEAKTDEIRFTGLYQWAKPTKQHLQTDMIYMNKLQK